ncbi:MAG: hypothetical protein M3P08_09755 [Thermoproteota archaeon]|nr:hypothetical protein [Thermoproteota archaeon]
MTTKTPRTNIEVLNMKDDGWTISAGNRRKSTCSAQVADVVLGGAVMWI